MARGPKSVKKAGSDEGRSKNRSIDTREVARRKKQSERDKAIYEASQPKMEIDYDGPRKRDVSPVIPRGKFRHFGWSLNFCESFTFRDGNSVCTAFPIRAMAGIGFMEEHLKMRGLSVQCVTGTPVTGIFSVAVVHMEPDYESRLRNYCAEVRNSGNTPLDIEFLRPFERKPNSTELIDHQSWYTRVEFLRGRSFRRPNVSELATCQVVRKAFSGAQKFGDGIASTSFKDGSVRVRVGSFVASESTVIVTKLEAPGRPNELEETLREVKPMYSFVGLAEGDNSEGAKGE